MPRTSRPVFPGIPHHVTHRGNRRGTIFFSDADRDLYLRWLIRYCTDHNVQVLAYCLMTNHMHLVVIPAAADSLEKVFRPLHTRYAGYINDLHEWSGHVLQGRFFSSPLDESYFWAAIRYVERNPVRAGMVSRAEHYAWSSARAHCGLSFDPVLTSDDYWTRYLSAIEDWSAWLAEADAPEAIDALRKAATHGLPCGTESFVRGLETLAGRMLRPKPMGRPRRAQAVPTQKLCGS